MNIVIPLAGKDPQFPNLPKPLIDAGGKPIIAHVLEHLRIEPEDTLIFVVLQEDVEAYHIEEVLKRIAGGRAIVRVLPKMTQGSPCSILEAARDLIDNDTDVLVDLGDVLRDTGQLYKDISSHRANVSGIISVDRRDMTGHLWGYVQTDDKGRASALLEKEPAAMAPWATTGLYYFSHGKDLVWATEEMVKHKSFLYKDTFFVGPVYNELITRGDAVVISKNTILVQLRGPEDVEQFIQSGASGNA